MHEFSLAECVVKEASAAAKEHGLTRVTSVRLKVGRLRQVVPEAMTTAFQAVATGTPLDGARLRLEFLPVRARCRDCGAETEVHDFIFVCPRCEGHRMDTLQGNELVIENLEGER
jgi:hydrogenase nickel incorporation protein HypA/HybF